MYLLQRQPVTVNERSDRTAYDATLRNSVCRSHAGIVSKRLDMSSKFLLYEIYVMKFM